MSKPLSYGDATESVKEAALRNFAGAGMGSMSFCTTPVELLSEDGSGKVLSWATGFFWLRGDTPCLVTNWHVVSGRNPFTKQLNKDGFIPRRIRFYGVEISVEKGSVRFERKPHTLEWKDDTYTDVLQGPPETSLGPVDIWAIPLTKDCAFRTDPKRTGFHNADKITCFINEHPLTKIATKAGDSCKILGYPINTYEGGKFPIWKTAYVASETVIGAGPYPLFFIDGLTAQGMSGAPVLRAVPTLSRMEDGVLVQDHAYDFIGVYAGRVGNQELERTGLAYAWYGSLIGDVLDYYKYEPIYAVDPEGTEGPKFG